MPLSASPRPCFENSRTRKEEELNTEITENTETEKKRKIKNPLCEFLIFMARVARNTMNGGIEISFFLFFSVFSVISVLSSYLEIFRTISQGAWRHPLPPCSLARNAFLSTLPTPVSGISATNSTVLGWA